MKANYKSPELEMLEAFSIPFCASTDAGADIAPIQVEQNDSFNWA